MKLHRDLAVAGSGAYEIASDPSTMLIGSRNIKVFDVTTGVERCVFEGHSGAVLSLDAQSDYLLSSSRYGGQNLSLWNLKTRERIDFLGHRRSVFTANFYDSQRIISSSKDGTLRIWEISKPARSRSAIRFPHPVRTHALYTDTKAVVGCENNQSYLVDLATRRKVRMIEGLCSPVDMKVVGNDCVILGQSGAYHYDLRTCDLVRTMNRKPNGSKFTSPKYTRELHVDEDKVFMATFTGKLIVVDWNTGRSLSSLSLGRQRLAFDYNRESSRLVCGDSEKVVKLWDHTDGTEVKESVPTSGSRCIVM
eukprot:TRINITY_DN1357_c1_g1_i2.p1 TRINITY_DN1357_c1_g1~~TRINITY_DN1357_c1_g1_i2.p1  ORF type:complete len:307 (-),score=22.67 TRINITY_DN1357_c1_g1_i2:93-1013(-)